MVEISLPVDSTFLSEVIYEGLLRYLSHDKSFSKAFKEALDRIPKDKRLTLSGNDISMIKRIRGKENLRIGFPEKLLQLLDDKYSNDVIYERVKNKENYTNLLSVDFIKELLECKGLNDVKLEDFSLILKKGEVIIGRKEITAPQILKVDRYTGYTSLETEFVSSQLTLYISKEVALLFLLGVYSSFITTFRQQQQTYYYFLFFSPDEILKLLNESSNVIRKYFLVKDAVIEKLATILGKSTSNELLLLEILLSVELQELMDREQLDKISLVLFKIAPEGQTYKIYEQIPITIFRNPPFYQVVERYFRDPQEFCKKLSEALSPNRMIFKALASLNAKNKFSEADNVLKAVQELYRFVILGDAQGWFGFVRELWNCYSKLVNSFDRREKSRSKDYIEIVKKFSIHVR